MLGLCRQTPDSNAADFNDDSFMPVTFRMLSSPYLTALSTEWYHPKVEDSSRSVIQESTTISQVVLLFFVFFLNFPPKQATHSLFGKMTFQSWRNQCATYCEIQVPEEALFLIREK